MIQETDFAQECMFRGLFFGVNAHYLLGVAKLRSGISDSQNGNLFGPFGITQDQWNENCNDLNFGLKFQPSQITSWRRQCGVFGFMTFKAQNELRLSLDRFPSAVELYDKQFGPIADKAKLTADLKTAFDATAALVQPAAQAILDDPAQADAPVTDPNSPDKKTLPSFGTGLFDVKAPRIMRQLMSDFQFTKVQAAGIVGNLGHETGGFRHFQELNPLGGGTGGFGWAQWTGIKVGPPPGRRKAFMDFCAAAGVEPTSDEGNYGFMKKELQTTEKATVPAVKAESTLEGATKAFETKFERAGVVALDSRVKFARKALAAFEAAEPA
jgi:hypothetical protein